MKKRLSLNLFKPKNILLGMFNRAISRPSKWFERKLFQPICWGNLRELHPKSRNFGYDRGQQSVVRYYIDNFFKCNASDIKGDVLEIGDDTYTRRHGNNLDLVEILHVVHGNPKATLVGDLTKADNIPSEKFDCLLLPQTFQFIFDLHSALENCKRILKPGGILLASMSGISQISRYDEERWGEYWRFTSRSAFILFSEIFGEGNVTIQNHGNVLAAISLLQGISSSELTKSELDFVDKDYEVVITARCQRAMHER